MKRILDRCGYIVEVLKGRAGKWYWKLKYTNGKTLAHSETYSSRYQAVKTARAVACRMECELRGI